ncbi:MAG: SecY-interacting protein Syd [Gammaproteobacteria bacterium]|jgi:SecY interacting protein Syd|nr:SecY-interacting protein Syd [Gammaproteobacteria bacterium]MBT4492349.1 SecY-interacting protein Syd [Gammaproteobacteria bacterium]MBT7371986.1 SecY-interacting protein Syd [Gammaproteobacteria bacterium]
MQALAEFIDRTLSLTEPGVLTLPFDSEWRSDCELYQAGDQTCWRPVPQSPVVSFAGLTNAVEADIHPDIEAYYTSYWSGTLEAESEEGRVSLIQLWNSEDFDRLVANLIGHALAKSRARHPFTVFFANTEPDSELFLSIDNETGTVLLEEPGKAPLREVESDIDTFLRRLEPKIRLPDIY